MNQLFQTFHLIIFFWMIKPSRSYRSIYFCRIPDQIRFTFKRFSASKIFHITGNPAHSEFLIIGLLASFLYTLCKCCTRRNNTPLRFSYIASFISTPSDIWPAHTDTCVWLIFSNTFVIAIPVVDLFFPIRSFPTCTIQPDTENIPIAGEKLSQLCQIVIIIFFSTSIARLVSIPWRKINSKFQSMAAACFGHFPDHISPAIFPRACCNAVTGISGRPQAEAVMVLTGKNYAFHAGILCCSHPLVCVKLCRIKNLQIFRSISPFPIGIRIHSKMKKRIKLCCLIGNLAAGGNYFY